MSASEPPDEPNVDPRRHRRGAGRARAGADRCGRWRRRGWVGRTPRVEPFAIAALVWAIVSIVIPLIGTIVAFVLAARAADLDPAARTARSRACSTSPRRAIIAGAVLALWVDRADRVPRAARRRLVERQRGGSHAAAVDHDRRRRPRPRRRPPVTTTTTKPPVTTVTVPPPTITVIPPPPTTVAPAPPTTWRHRRRPPTHRLRPRTHRLRPRVAPTTKPPPTTTPDSVKEAKIQAKLVKQVGASNRGVPSDERVVVSYTPGRTCSSPGRSTTDRWVRTRRVRPTARTEPTDPPPTTSSTSTTTTTTTTDHDHARPATDHDDPRRAHDPGAGAVRGQADPGVDPTAAARR